jgi:hypothetical protein
LFIDGWELNVMNRFLRLATAVLAFTFAHTTPAAAIPILADAILQSYADADLVSDGCAVVLFTDTGGTCSLVSGGQNGDPYVYQYLVVNPPDMWNEVFQLTAWLPKDAAFTRTPSPDDTGHAFLFGYEYLPDSGGPHIPGPNIFGRLGGPGNWLTEIVVTSHTPPLNIVVAAALFSGGRIPGQPIATLETRVNQVFGPDTPGVPEPATVVLFGGGVLAVIARRRRYWASR